ncbi:MAG TPA: DUF2254 domain-containing protein, partial [Chloroflexota bacterium]|nr:DUF2254 domain-containing protein [Chloroflexota bacterium]
LALWMLRLGSTGVEWLGAGDGEDARNLLSTLLGAVIGMASIVFSITVVSLSLAANSYGPRLIRTFRSSRSTQLVIGTFMMSIVYLLLVLRAVRGEADATEVPEAAVAFGSLLALVSVLALLAFIQSVATLMVADEVVRRVRKEFNSAIGKLPKAGEHSTSARLPDDFEAGAVRIPLPREGYVQSVEYSEIVEWAERRDSIVRLDFRPGDFVVDGDRKVLIYPAPHNSEEARKQIGRFIVSGEKRTPTQDLEFATRHLVEVAVRALSPGVNDPFTAMAVIDRLRGGLARLCQHDLPSKVLVGSSGKLRVWRDETTFRGVVDTAFRQIRQAGAANPAVLVHMLKALGALGEHVRTDEQRDALEGHAKLVATAGGRDVSEPADLEDLQRELRRALSALSAGACGA